MAKSLLYRLFGIGKIPAPVMNDLQQEGIILLDEGVSGSTTFLNFRAPGRRYAWRRQWYTASIALTRTRLLALQYASQIINVPLTDERLAKLRFSVENNATVFCIAFDASLFHADWSGTIEYRFRTEQASQFEQDLREPMFRATE